MTRSLAALSLLGLLAAPSLASAQSKPTTPKKDPWFYGPAVVLYPEQAYQGRKLRFYSTSVPDLKAFKFDNLTSALRVRANCTVTLYEHANYRGKSSTFRGEGHGNLRFRKFDDMASSMKVSCKTPVTLYVGLRYTKQAYPVSRKGVKALSKAKFDNMTSSVKILPECSAKLFEQPNFEGRSVHLRYNTPDLRGLTFTRRTSSVKVYCLLKPLRPYAAVTGQGVIH